MARSFSNAKLLSALVADRVSVSLSRRGYAAAAAGTQSVRSGGAAGVMAPRKGGEETAKTSWVPDPVTGYYRPEGHANDIDVAELREMLLKNNKNNSNINRRN